MGIIRLLPIAVSQPRFSASNSIRPHSIRRGVCDKFWLLLQVTAEIRILRNLYLIRRMSKFYKYLDIHNWSAPVDARDKKTRGGEAIIQISNIRARQGLVRPHRIPEMASAFSQQLIIYESGTFTEIWISGIYTALLLLTVWLIVSKREYSRQKKIILISCNMAPYLVASGHAALAWAVSLKIMAGTVAMSRDSWFPMTYNVFFVVNNILAEAVFLWRCWIVWGRKWPVVVVPTALTLIGTIIASAQMTPWDEKSTFIGGTPMNSLKIYSMFPIGSVIITTILTTCRIVQVQKVSGRFGGLNKRRFNSVIEIIVESAALYSISLLAFTVISYIDWGNGEDDPLHPQVFGMTLCVQNIHLQISGLAPLLINLRVQAGFSRPADDWSTSTSPLPSIALRFASRRKSTVTDAALEGDESAGFESRSVVQSG